MSSCAEEGMARSACAMTAMMASNRSRGQAAPPAPPAVTLRSSDSGVMRGGCPDTCGGDGKESLLRSLTRGIKCS